MKRKSNHLAILLLVVSTILTGINTPVVRYGLATVPIPLFGFLRQCIPLLILAPVMLLAKRKRAKTKHILMALFYGLVVYVGSSGLFYLGVKDSGAVNAAIIGLLGPIVMFSFSVEVMREKYNARILTGIAIAFAGSMLVVFGPMVAHQQLTFGGSAVGNLLLLASVLCCVGGAWVAKTDLKHIDQLQLLFWSLIPGTVIFGLLSMGQWSQIPAVFQNPGTRYAVLFGAVLNGIAAYLFCFYALKRIQGKEYGIFQYIDPAVAAIVAVLFFGESFTPLLLAGVAVIFVGLCLAEVHRHKAHPHSHLLRNG